MNKLTGNNSLSIVWVLSGWWSLVHFEKRQGKISWAIKQYNSIYFIWTRKI